MGILRKKDAEHRLVKQIAKGSKTAFEQLFLKYREPVYRFSYTLLKNDSIAEDVVHETFMVLWRQADRFQGKSKVSTWLFGIAFNVSQSQRVYFDRHRESISEEFEMVDESSSNPNNSMRQAEYEHWVNVGLGKLSPDQRIVVELTYYSGFSYIEIADIIDCPVNTVKTRMFHARKNLRTFIPNLISKVDAEIATLPAKEDVE